MGKEDGPESDLGFIDSTITNLASRQVVRRAYHDGCLRRGAKITLIGGTLTSAVGVLGIILNEPYGPPVALSGLALNITSFSLKGLETATRNLE